MALLEDELDEDEDEDVETVDTAEVAGAFGLALLGARGTAEVLDSLLTEEEDELVEVGGVDLGLPRAEDAAEVAGGLDGLLIEEDELLLLDDEDVLARDGLGEDEGTGGSEATKDNSSSDISSSLPRRS